MIKQLFSSLAICFSMYSVIKAPKVDWDKANMRYVFCFFPLVGVLIGGLEYLWFLCAAALSINMVLYAAVATIIPVALSGGIHIDGFIDTCDAFFSFGDSEKRLAILKDPLVGAFGIIYSIVYFLLTFGLYSQLFSSHAIIAATLIFPVSRALGGLVTIGMRSSKSSGLQYLFSSSSVKKLSAAVIIVWIVVLAVAFSLSAPIAAGVCIVSLLLLFLWFRAFSYKNFNGITGDLVGFFICISELLMLACCVFAGGLA